MPILSHPTYRRRWWRPAAAAVLGIIAIVMVLALGVIPSDKSEPAVLPPAVAAVATSPEPRQGDSSQEEAETRAQGAILRLLILERARPRPFGFFH